MKEIKIPVRHETGSFLVSELSGGTGELVMRSEYGDVLCWNDGGFEMRLYNIPEEDTDKLTAHYDEDWRLSEVTLGDRLVYISYADDSAAWNAIREFAAAEGRRIADEVAATEGKVGRVFVEYYKDWESFDFGVIVASEKELWKVAAAAENEDCINMSGEFSHQNKICADNARFSVMFGCLPKGLTVGLMGMSIEIMTEAVRSACDRLDKSVDFDFIAEAYD